MPDHHLDLIERVRRGDCLAYADLVQVYRRPLFRLAWAILGSADDAEDCVQEAFVRAYQALRRRPAPSYLEPWLRRITVNCALNHLRSRRVRSSDPMPEAGALDDCPPPQELAEAAELHRCIRLAWTQLPPRQRVAFALFHMQGLSLRESAEAMGCSVGAVKVHLHRARERLAARLRGGWASGD